MRHAFRQKSSYKIAPALFLFLKFGAMGTMHYLCSQKTIFDTHGAHKRCTYSHNGSIGRLIKYNQKTENVSLSNGGLRPSRGNSFTGAGRLQRKRALKSFMLGVLITSPLWLSLCAFVTSKSHQDTDNQTIWHKSSQNGSWHGCCNRRGETFNPFKV